MCFIAPTRGSRLFRVQRSWRANRRQRDRPMALTRRSALRAGMLIVPVAAGLTLAGPDARAADPLPVAAPVVVVIPPWHGIYVGGGGGYAWSDQRFRAEADFPGLPTLDREFLGGF